MKNRESQKGRKGRKSGKAMRMLSKQLCSIALLFLLISFATFGCGEKNKASKAPVVSKKIAVQSKASSPVKEGKAETAASEKMAGDKATFGQDAITVSRIYDPQKRINPFTPLFGGKTKPIVDDKSKRKKRIPQTPLEKIGLDQLKLVAIIRASTGNRALVEDTVGKGYIIKNGTYIGLNSGMVTQINPNSVVIEEELENLKGELVLQNTEIKLQKPAGE
ncbi:MAG: pilus assembly protein PilP [Desulfosarcina sp.]|jgi:type IV pilus assembly protein PilP